MNLTEILQGAGFLSFLGLVVTAWFKFKTDTRANANTNWSAIVEGYKEQVRFFSEQVQSIRTEFKEATDKYELTIDSLEKDRDHYKELYLQSDRKRLEYKEKYEAIIIQLKERGGETFENELESEI